MLLRTSHGTGVLWRKVAIKPTTSQKLNYSWRSLFLLSCSRQWSSRIYNKTDALHFSTASLSQAPSSQSNSNKNSTTDINSTSSTSDSAIKSELLHNRVTALACLSLYRSTSIWQKVGMGSRSVEWCQLCKFVWQTCTVVAGGAAHSL